MIRTLVQSSQIAAIGYDHETRTLEVEFNPGKINTDGDTTSQVYAYDNVDPLDFAEFGNPGASIGKAFHALIKGKYEHRKVETIIERAGETVIVKYEKAAKRAAVKELRYD